MTVFISVDPGEVLLRARAVSADAVAEGDLVRRVRPGGRALGKTYDEWRALAPGPVEFGAGGPAGGAPPKTPGS